MPNIPFEPTNSWCYTFARYQVLPEILAMREVAAGEPFRLVEMVKKVMDKHLTEQEQATKYVRRDTGKPLSISATVKFYVPFVGKKTEQLIPLGDGMYRLPSVADVEAAAGEVEEAAAGTIDEDGEVVDFDGWVYAFSFPTLVRENDRYPIKIGMTVVDVEGRVMGQCRCRPKARNRSSRSCW